MKNIEKMSPAEIAREGFQALCERLGPAGAFRYHQIAGTGWGDYTRQRDQIIGEPTLEEIVQECRRIEQERTRGPAEG